VGTVFLGTYAPRLDEKGRLAFPAKYREDLEGGVVVAPGQENCLFVYTRADFVARTAALAASPLSNQATRQRQRMLAARAHDDVLDKQGRITLPSHLREYAGLERDVVVVGALSHLEIWDASRWSAYQSENQDAFAALDDGEVLPQPF
jgi:MraZ protein